MMQEAAGAFSHLQARVVPQLTTPRPEDLSQECTGMLAALCMAQVRGIKIGFPHGCKNFRGLQPPCCGDVCSTLVLT